MFNILKIFSKQSITIIDSSEQAEELPIREDDPTPTVSRETQLDAFNNLVKKFSHKIDALNSMYFDTILESNKMEILSDLKNTYPDIDLEGLDDLRKKSSDNSFVKKLQDLEHSKYRMQYYMYHSQFISLMLLFNYQSTFKKELIISSLSQFLSSLIFFDVEDENGKTIESISIAENGKFDLAKEFFSNENNLSSNEIANTSKLEFKHNTISQKTLAYDFANSKVNVEDSSFKLDYNEDQKSVKFTYQHNDNIKEVDFYLKGGKYDEINRLTIAHYKILFLILKEHSTNENFYTHVENYFNLIDDIVPDPFAEIVNRTKQSLQLNLQHQSPNQNLFTFALFSNVERVQYLPILKSFQVYDDSITLDSIFQLIRFAKSRVKEYNSLMYDKELINAYNIIKSKYLSGVKPIFDNSTIKQYLENFKSYKNNESFIEDIALTDIFDLITIVTPFLERVNYIIIPDLKNTLSSIDLSHDSIINDQKEVDLALNRYFESLSKELDETTSISKRKEREFVDNTNMLFDNFISYKEYKEKIAKKKSEDEEMFEKIMDKSDES